MKFQLRTRSTSPNLTSPEMKYTAVCESRPPLLVALVLIPVFASAAPDLHRYMDRNSVPSFQRFRFPVPYPPGTQERDAPILSLTVVIVQSGCARCAASRICCGVKRVALGPNGGFLVATSVLISAGGPSLREL